MTKKSWVFLGVCALAGAVSAMRRQATDAQDQATREVDRCEKLLQQLYARSVNFR